MRYLDRLINFIFSLAVLVISAIMVFISTGFIEFSTASNYLQNNIFSTDNNTLTCIVSIVTFLAALKTTVFLSKTSPKKKAAIMVDTTNGKIQIASETIENTAKNVAKSFENVKDAQVRMVKEKKGVSIFMVLLVLPHTNIIELSSKVQDEVKEAVQSTTGVKVNNIDIKVKNIADKSKSTKVVKETTMPVQKTETLEETNIPSTIDISLEDTTVSVEPKTEEILEETSEDNKNE